MFDDPIYIYGLISCGGGFLLLIAIGTLIGIFQGGRNDPR